MGYRTQVAVDAMPASGSRAIAALNLLFEVCEEIKNERIESGVSDIDAAPVIVLDEVQDLIQNVCIKEAGGEAIFAVVGTLLASYGPGRHAVRCVVAGSTAEVYFLISKLSAARNGRVAFFRLRDPSSEAMSSALVQRGYSSSDADTMIALCGTRLRLFEEALRVGPAGASAATFLDSARFDAITDFSSVFSGLDNVETAALVRALDALCADPCADAARMRSLDALFSSESLQHIDTSPILYLDRERRFSFQSQLHSNTWKVVRSRYAPASALLPVPALASLWSIFTRI
jgi:hypothetical protein